MIVVDSLERIGAKVREHGGTVVGENIPVPGSAISTFRDPVVGTYLTVMRAGEEGNSAG